MATPSSNLKSYSEPHIIAPSDLKMKITSFFWSCISATASRCFNQCLKRIFNSSDRSIEGIFHVIHDLEDKRFKQVNLVIKAGDKFWCEMLPGRSASATVKPQRMQIPNIPDYRVQDMISHLVNCEIVNREGRDIFVETHHIWTIQRRTQNEGPYTNTTVHLVQHHTDLYYRFLNGSELVYKKIEFDSDSKEKKAENAREQVKRRIRELSKKPVIID